MILFPLGAPGPRGSEEASNFSNTSKLPAPHPQPGLGGAVYYLHCSLQAFLQNNREVGVGNEANVPCGLKFAINQELDSPDAHLFFTSLEAPNSFNRNAPGFAT